MSGNLSDAAPKDSFLARYKQTVFNQENGLGSTEVNCIYQTQSGYIWVGTDGGLYRYNGNEFKIYNLWETDKDDVYFINDLFQDSEGRLWVSTNNYGLFYIKGSEVHHFSSDYYDGIKCINGVREDSAGGLYVATAYGLYKINISAENFETVEDLKGIHVKKLTRAGNEIWGLCNGNRFFRMEEDGTVMTFSTGDYTQEEISAIYGMEDGTVYLGTMGTEILHMEKNMKVDKMRSGRDGINSLYYDGSKLFVCAESGMGYFEKDGTFYTLFDAEIDRYITSMIMDYEGDYWFTSSRMGILFLGRSKFQNYNEKYGLSQTPANCIREINNRLYLGTDEGLLIMNSKNKTEDNELTEFLGNASIKDIMQDSNGNIWVTTSRKFGIVRYSPDGKIKTFGRADSLLTNLVNCAIELKNGDIAVATEEGVSVISTSGTVKSNFSHDSGMEFPNIISLFQAEDGRLFAGSDGGGLYVIDQNRIRQYTEDDGLTSNVVTCFAQGEKGIWIGTDNGLSIFEETIRPVSNIDFSNNIYDILTEIIDNEKQIWIIGSKGILKTNEDELLRPEGVSGRYYAQGDGLSGVISLYSRNITRKEILYLCTNKGVFIMNTKKIPLNEVAPKLTISEINVDDKVYHLDQLGGSLNIPSTTQRLSIAFSVLSYTNRENIQVEYSLDGFDVSPITISPSDPMMAVYTNLAGGTYTFTVRAMNGDGVASEQDITFTINKELGFFEQKYVRISIMIGIGLILLLLILGIILFSKRVKGQNKEIEKLEKEHEVAVKSSTAKTDFLAHMSNEIKTPVNAIISLAEGLQVEADPEQREQNLEAIVHSGQDILGKVDETIQLARLEAGKVTVNEAPYSITTLVCDISDHAINNLDQRPVRFLVDLGENIPDVMIGDYDKIKNVLEILLDNAQKYTKEGTITLFVDCYEASGPTEKDQLLFSISDTGIGIQKERLQHLFEVYNIADNKKLTGYEGSGIGLAIAKQLTEIMGGEIEVESTYGAGSTFTVSLAQKRPDQNMVPLAIESEQLERVTKEEAQKMLLPDVHVLLVDDMEIGRTVAAGVMKQMEVRGDLAASGVRAIDMVMNQQYDLVFMDLSMPVMSGTDTMREIRELAREGMDELPIIAMTEDALSDDNDKLLEEGFSEVIVKPLDLVNLASVAMKYLPPEKIHYRSEDLTRYISESRFASGLTKLQPYLDVSGTLEKIGGSIEVYNRILSTFFNQNQNAPEELKQKFNKNLRAFRTRIHSVKTGVQNIGATDLLGKISKIDAALNIGNKEYVRNHLSNLILTMEEVLDAIANYLNFAVEQQGITDEEYAAKARETENEEKTEAKDDRSQKSAKDGSAGGAAEEVIRDQIDSAALVRMLAAAKAQDGDQLSKEILALEKDRYGTEDTEFLQALAEKVQEHDYDTILDMIGTYVELKKM